MSDNNKNGGINPYYFLDPDLHDSTNSAWVTRNVAVGIANNTIRLDHSTGLNLFTGKFFAQISETQRFGNNSASINLFTGSSLGRDKNNDIRSGTQFGAHVDWNIVQTSGKDPKKPIVSINAHAEKSTLTGTAILGGVTVQSPLTEKFNWQASAYGGVLPQMPNMPAAGHAASVVKGEVSYGLKDIFGEKARNLNLVGRAGYGVTSSTNDFAAQAGIGFHDITIPKTQIKMTIEVGVHHQSGQHNATLNPVLSTNGNNKPGTGFYIGIR